MDISDKSKTEIRQKLKELQQKNFNLDRCMIDNIIYGMYKSFCLCRDNFNKMTKIQKDELKKVLNLYKELF